MTRTGEGRGRSNGSNSRELIGCPPTLLLLQGHVHDDSDDDGDRAESDFEDDDSMKIMTHDSKTQQADIGRSFLDASS